MTVSLNSLNSSHNLSKRKAFGIQTTIERFKMHHLVISDFMMTFLVAACMMFMLSMLVPGDVNKVFAQGQQDNLSQDQIKSQKPLHLYLLQILLPLPL